MRSPAGARLITREFLVIMLSTFAYFLSVGALIPTLPRYVEGPLGGNNFDVGLAIGAFSLTAVLLRPLTGRISDRRGRRVLMITGSALVALSVAGYVVADSLALLLLLRAVTGGAEAFFYVGAASAVNDLAPDERRGEAISFFSLSLYAGLALGPLIGETTLEAAGFTWAWGAAAITAAAAAIVAVGVPDTRTAEIAETPARLVHSAGLLPGTVLATSIWGLSGFTGFVPLYALELGLDGSRWVFAAYSVVVLAVRLFGARIPDRLGAASAARTSLVVSAAGLLVIAAWPAAAALTVGAIVFGLGQALAFPSLMTIAVRGASASERGSVVGTFTAFFDLAFGLGAITLGGVAELLGYRGLFAAAAAVAVAGWLVMVRTGVGSRQPAVT